MFRNLSTKTKFKFNMALIIIAFGIVTLQISEIEDNTIYYLNNFVILIILAISNYNLYMQIKGGTKRVNGYLEDLMQFAFMKTNEVNKAKYIKLNLNPILSSKAHFIAVIDGILFILSIFCFLD